MNAPVDERVARATMLRISEPANSALIEHVDRVGVMQALHDIRTGASIEGVEADGLRHRLQTASGEADLEAAARCGARLVCPGDAEWPTRLDDLGWVGRASFGLWVSGPHSLVEATETSVAIVGTRTATDYGASVAADMAFDLGERGWAVVSGLASGIDSAAHRGVLSAGGMTIGVLACGIDVPYPRGNRPLYDRLSAEGLVVSEHPPGSAPQRFRFLVRNRIIAALSLGTVVVEMALRSGARSTAAHAAAINRHVMCVPGPISSAMSGGCHRLLRERPETVLVTSAAEVVEQCGHMGELAERESAPARTRDLLGPMVARVFEGVPVQKPANVSGIANAAGVSVPVAAAALAALACAGLVECAGDRWAMTAEGRRDRRARTGARVDQLELDWW
jgi:DNA processing protein